MASAYIRSKGAGFENTFQARSWIANWFDTSRWTWLTSLLYVSCSSMVAFRDTLNSFPVEGSSKERTLCLITGIFLTAFSSNQRGKLFLFLIPSNTFSCRVWRISVGSSKEVIVGNCLLCNNTFDDYSPRCRCRLCRMLVLVCNHCRVLHAGPLLFLYFTSIVYLGLMMLCCRLKEIFMCASCVVNMEKGKFLWVLIPQINLL